jgi:hypothetical protein
MPSIKLSQQTYDEFERLKAIMWQMLDKDELDDDQVVGSLVWGFLESLSHDMIDHTHMPHKGWSCCGGSCKTDDPHKKEWCCGWACWHKH